MLNELLDERALPDIPEVVGGGGAWETAREKIVELLLLEQYGYMPPSPVELSHEVTEHDERFCAGKAALKKVLLTARFSEGSFSFPISAVIPKGEGKHPFFVHINFRDSVPDKYMPTEEICDAGFALLSFSYKDVASDDGDFTSLLAGALFDGGKRRPSDAGKIAMWAWAASRVMDYAQTLDCLDFKRSAVVGHSRLGKTALLAGALDKRFAAAISNNSGCAGAALYRGKSGERMSDIYGRFPYWFCENYEKYAKAVSLPRFDQHFLLSALAPRRVYVASAAEDFWADSVSEYLSCVAASRAYERLGLPGFAHPDRLPAVGDVFHEGQIGYHLRAGLHYLSREDWRRFIEFMKKQFPKEGEI